MEYKGKSIWSDAPASSDSYRKNYLSGIEKYIEDMKKNSGEARRSFMSPEMLAANPEHYRKEYRKMLGMDVFSRHAPTVEREKVGEDDTSEIFRLTLTGAEGIPFYFMLLLPKGIRKPMPLVIAQHGGGGTPELAADFFGKNNYNHMVRRLLDRGAAVLLPQLLLWSRKEIPTQRAHPIEFDRRGIDAELRRFGTSITALEITMISRCIDFAVTLDEIDPERIGMMGLSYGGFFTLHTMAADTRIKAGYTCAAFNDRNVYNWQDWCYFGSALKFHDAEVAALCAPRRLYIQIGKQDGVFDYRSALPEMERIPSYFKAFGCPENLKVSVWEGGHTVSDDDDGYDFIFKTLN